MVNPCGKTGRLAMWLEGILHHSYMKVIHYEIINLKLDFSYRLKIALNLVKVFKTENIALCKMNPISLT